MFPNGNILPERPLRTAKCTRPGTFAPQVGGAVAPCEADVLRLLCLCRFGSHEQ